MSSDQCTAGGGGWPEQSNTLVMCKCWNVMYRPCPQGPGLTRLYSARNRRGASREAKRTADVAAVCAHAAGGHGDLEELEDVAQHHAQRLHKAPHPRLMLRLCLCTMLVVILLPSSMLSARSKPRTMPSALMPCLMPSAMLTSCLTCVSSASVSALSRPIACPSPCARVISGVRHHVMRISATTLLGSILSTRARSRTIRLVVRAPARHFTTRRAATVRHNLIGRM